MFLLFSWRNLARGTIISNEEITKVLSLVVESLSSLTVIGRFKHSFVFDFFISF